MYITITGELGSGKSTVAKILKEKHGFLLYSTGTIQREIAQEKGITTLELNRLMTEDVHNIYDKMIDDKTVEIARDNVGRDVIFDSRMAWHFVENSFKVYVTVNLYTAAERVRMADRGKEEHYDSAEEAAAALTERKRLENIRFAELYHVDTVDFDNYDLVVDSSKLKPEELAGFILEKAGEWAEGKAFGRQVYLDAARLYPTKREWDADRPGEPGRRMGTEAGTEPEGMSTAGPMGQPVKPRDIREGMPEDWQEEPVDIVLRGGFYFILRGHEQVCRCIRDGRGLVRVRLLKEDEDGKEAGRAGALGEFAPAGRGCYEEWERRNSIKFSRYPK